MKPFEASASRIVSEALSPIQSRFEEPDRLKKGRMTKLSHQAGVQAPKHTTASAGRNLMIFILTGRFREFPPGCGAGAATDLPAESDCEMKDFLIREYELRIRTADMDFLEPVLTV